MRDNRGLGGAMHAPEVHHSVGQSIKITINQQSSYIVRSSGGGFANNLEIPALTTKSIFEITLKTFLK